MKSLIPVIDGRNYLFITSFSLYKNLKSGEHEEWFLRTMKDTIRNNINYFMREWKAKEFYIVFDGDQNFRKNVYPDYKASRTEKPELIKKVEEIFLKEWSQEFGWKIVKQNGMEGDDWMSVITQDKENDYLLVTGDEDMHQLTIYDNVQVLSIVKKKVFGKNKPNHMPNRYEFEECNGYNVAYKKVWLGCNSDDVPKLLPRGKSEAFFYKNFDLDWIQKSYSALEQNQYYYCPYIDVAAEDVYRNFMLTSLLHHNHKQILSNNFIDPKPHTHLLNIFEN